MRAVLGITALSALAGAPSAQPAAADASSDCPLVGVHRVAVGLQPTVVRFRVPAVHCGATRGNAWQIRIPRWGVDVTTEFPSAIFDPDYLPNADTKPVSVEVRFFNPENGAAQGQLFAPATFRLVHQTTWGSSVKASRVDSSHVKISGTLRRADWEKGRWAPYAGARATIASTRSAAAVAKPRLDAHGHFSVTVTSRSTRAWRVSFGGNGSSARAESGAVLQ